MVSRPPASRPLAIRRWQGATGKSAILNGDGRTFDEKAAGLGASP